MPPVRRQFLGAAAGMCKGGPTPGLHLEYAGPFTETVLPGALARRMQRRLERDQATVRVRNLEANRYVSQGVSAGMVPRPASGKRWRLLGTACCTLLLACALSSAAAQDDAPPPAETEVWQPVPPKVEAPAGGVPSDATVLFAGGGTDAWETVDGGAVGWKVVDGALVVTPGSGDIRTREAFGDVQLHLEFRTQARPTGEGQGASNSGVFLMERYELQVLDSYRNTTYVNGQAASVYKQYPPLVNASRPPGEWQSYDVLFLAPRFAADGSVQAPARMTVLHNGVLVQHDVALRGTTVYRGQPSYEAHAAQLPLRLQDHGDAVAFRNIWIRAIARPTPQ